MSSYKIITQNDKWFSGKFDPVKLELRLNELAKDGWKVVSMVTASRDGLLHGGGKDELIVLLEKTSLKSKRVSSGASPFKQPQDKAEPDGDGVYQL